MIDDAAIADLQKEYEAAFAVKSTVLKRRAFKRVSQRGLQLVEKKPDASNRFLVLKILLFARKELVALKPGSRSRNEFWATAKALAAAPDAYAQERLPAEIMLLRLEFSRDEVSKDDQVSRIVKLVGRYRQTSAEAESMIIASDMLFDLKATTELGTIRQRMVQEFALTPKVAEFLRDRFRERSYSVRPSGTFKRSDDRELKLPMDLLGHVYLSCYWSTTTPGLKEKLESIEALRKKYEGDFQVLSFSLDQLKDAGKSHLDQLGLKWHAMHLPKGFDSPYFRCFGTDPNFLIRITNANGYLTITPIGSVREGRGIASRDRQKITDLDQYFRINRENPLHLSRLLSLRAGEFLIVDPFKPFDSANPPELSGNAGLKPNPQKDVPKDVLDAIQSRFSRPPERYLLSKDKCSELYRDVIGLCSAASEKYPEASNSWIVRNRQIVALMGLWGIEGDPKHLQEAVGISRKLIEQPVPSGAEIVPHYCLAKRALRGGPSGYEKAISRFNDSLKQKGTARALGAACILSIDAGQPSLLSENRTSLFKTHSEEPSAWPVTSLLLDRSVTGRMFRASFYGTELNTMPAGYGSAQMDTEVLDRKLSMTFKTLDGKTESVPSGDANVFDAVVFLGLPQHKAAAKLHGDLLRRAKGMVGKKDFNFRVAFLTDDSEAVRKFMKSQRITVPVVLVPKGYRNPQILRLGVARANHQPNLIVVRHDGSVVWSMTGNNHLYQSGPALWLISRYAVHRRLHCALQFIYKGLHDRAKELLKGRPPSSMKYYWAAALACLDATSPDRDKALQTLNDFIKKNEYYSRRYRYSSIAKHHHAKFERTALAAALVSRARILEKQGKTAQAQEDIAQARSLVTSTIQK